MIETKNQNKHRILSTWIIVCGLLYIFAYQFKLPFKADTFLYGMVVGLVAMILFDGKIIVSKQVILFLLVVFSSFVGLSYTTMPSEGLREAVLFTFFAGLFWLSLTNSALIKSFTKWIYIASIIVVLSSLVHFLAPIWFNALMSQVMRKNAYEQLIWSFTVDTTFAGLAAYTSNATFAAAIVFGNSFLNMTYKKETPIIKSKLLNIVLLALSMFSIIICSKRGIFVATIVASIVLMFYLYRGSNFFSRFLGVAVLASVVLTVLYNTNEFVSTFLNRFVGDDIMTGRDTIYETLMADFGESNFLIGRGTSATYELAEEGAHNIYIQILYDHGIIFSFPYYILLLYNYYLAFKNNCPLSIFVQTMFLVYGLSGNPLYSNMFMMIYIYHVLYATKMPELVRNTSEHQRTEFNGNTAVKLKEQRV